MLMIFITACFALESGHSVTEMWSSLFDSAKKDSEQKKENEEEKESLKVKLKESSDDYKEAENTVNDALQASHQEKKSTVEDMKKNPIDEVEAFNPE